MGVPNILSCLRIGAALFLPAIPAGSAAFICVYIFCGFSDIADGYLARKYKWTSKLGAKLDSLGDFMFWIVILLLLYLRTSIRINRTGLCVIAVIAGIRLLNLILTKLKFKEWGMLHSYGNKAAGIVLYTAVLIFFIEGGITWLFISIVFIISLLSAMEETIILIIAKKYDPDYKTLFTMKRE